ncbi:polysaccharide deacetylase family protein [Halobacillus litoralis]|uniref:polysaccharide deacetylase family protein n=1 Tax=Halobacillus litoralis TaxID=45668 RepID=UPI001CD6BEAE|nr:polysaccharide deacetylase family protein [Halobacillus litoralis]MCA0970925.1 polysaccharide deacetylase family protein [Halobacillus litoralis]
MKKLILGIVIAVVALVMAAYGTYEWMNARGFQAFGELTRKVEAEDKVVALTFDDGPTDKVEELLPLLEEYDAKATFFLIGKDMEEHMDEAEAIVEAGHQVGNHTYTHDYMVFKRYSFYKSEVDKTNALIREAGYEGEIDFRPPYGKKLIGLPYYLKQQEMETIMWNLEPDTFYSAPEEKVDYVVDGVTPGSIILTHPMYDDSDDALKAVEGILKSLTEMGYTFVTVDELQGA